MIITASYVFYGWWDWHFIFLLAGCTLWNQLLAVQIARTPVRSRRKLLVAVAVAGDLCVLAYFKYFDFFVNSSHNLADMVGLGLPLATRTIVLPVGISFYTFMAISYVVDTYRGEFEPVDARPVRRLPVLLPASRRRADRARRGAPAADGDAAGSRAASTRAVPST